AGPPVGRAPRLACRYSTFSALRSLARSLTLALTLILPVRNALAGLSSFFESAIRSSEAMETRTSASALSPSRRFVSLPSVTLALKDASRSVMWKATVRSNPSSPSKSPDFLATLPASFSSTLRHSSTVAIRSSRSDQFQHEGLGWLKVTTCAGSPCGRPGVHGSVTHGDVNVRAYRTLPVALALPLRDRSGARRRTTGRRGASSGPSCSP